MKLLVLICVQLASLASGEADLASGEADNTSAISYPRYARVVGQIETLWQRPPSGVPVKGVLFMAHGCNHQATDFFTRWGPDGWEFEECRTSNVGKCLGLPEERLLVGAARDRGYVVVAVSGGSGKRSCWDPVTDPGKVRRAINHVIKEEGLDKWVSIFAIGASSGGSFLGNLVEAQSLKPRLKCIAPVISSIEVSVAKALPTMFIHMPADKRTAKHIDKAYESLRAGHVRTERLEVKPRRVTRKFLEAGMSGEEADEVIDLLKGMGLLTSNGTVSTNPRIIEWSMAIRNHKAWFPTNDTLIKDESGLAEMLNVAFAEHEFTSEYIHEMLDFCEEAIRKKDEL